MGISLFIIPKVKNKFAHKAYKDTDKRDSDKYFCVSHTHVPGYMDNCDNLVLKFILVFISMSYYMLDFSFYFIFISQCQFQFIECSMLPT